MQKLFGRLLVILGGGFVIASALLYYLQTSSTSLPLSSYLQEKYYDSNGSSNDSLIVEKIGIDLVITPTSMADSNDESNFLGVSYLSSTPEPGDTGNSILYGHNWKSLLGRLSELTVDDTIVVRWDSSLRTFRVKEKKIVAANDTSILENTENAQITLYTCTGFLDSKRLVIVAELI